MRRKKIIYGIIQKAPHLLMLALLFAVSLLVGAYLPLRIPLHWDKQGVVDRIGLKHELIFLLPFAAALIFAIGVYAESRFVSPSRKLTGVISFIQFFFISLIFVLQIRALLRACGIWIPMERLMTIPTLILFAFVSGLFYGAEYRSGFGVKTKWTVGSRVVWERTNKLACVLFRCSAGLMLIPIFFYESFYIFLAAPPAVSLIVAVIYSRAIYDGKNGGGGDNGGDSGDGENP